MHARPAARGPRKQTRKMVRHRVVSPGAKRVATRQAVQREVAARGRTMHFKRTQRIHRASRFEAARTAQPSAQKQPIAPHGGHQKLLRHYPQRCQKGAHSDGHAEVARDPAAANTCSSSVRVACLSAPDAALVNRLRSKGPRRRMTHRPASRRSRCRATAARIWRLIKLRVTARRAWRFGTTAPNHNPVRGRSSTGGETVCNAPVDNSRISASDCDRLTSCGNAGRWCSAKCALLTRLRTRNTRSKSDERTMQPITAQFRPGGSQPRRTALASGSGEIRPLLHGRK